MSKLTERERAEVEHWSTGAHGVRLAGKTLYALRKRSNR